VAGPRNFTYTVVIRDGPTLATLHDARTQILGSCQEEAQLAMGRGHSPHPTGRRNRQR
jgi:hypothetical protein